MSSPPVATGHPPDISGDISGCVQGRRPEVAGPRAADDRGMTDDAAQPRDADQPGGADQPAQTDARASAPGTETAHTDRKSTRLNSSHVKISYAVFCLEKKSEAGGPPTTARHGD